VSCFPCLLIGGPRKLRVGMWSCIYLGGNILVVAIHVLYFLCCYVGRTRILHAVLDMVYVL